MVLLRETNIPIVSLVLTLAIFVAYLPPQPLAQQEEKIHFRGYGELHYNNTSQEGKTDKMDFHRMVIGISYHFNDWIVFDTEVDFEHAATEMELEYAHLEFLLSDAFNVRVGSMLMPVGYLNEFHEPPLFYSVERPYVQKNVIPTTWQEGGVGIFGSPHPDLRYRLYLVGGLDASKFKAGSGIRKGRGKVASAKAENLAIVGRVEYIGALGLQVGASGYFGGAAQGDSELGNASLSFLEADL
ncbi:MAG: porin, partial [bacterium]